MTDASSRLGDRAGELRRAFDRSFAQPVHADTEAKESLLAIRVGSHACAVRLSEIAGLFAGKRITRLPSNVATLLGIAGFRGAIMPVYDLGMLLGHPASANPHWLLIASGQAVAFAFKEFDGHLRVTRDAILPQAPGQGAGRHVREFLGTDDVIRPIVHLPSILDAIGAQAPEAVLPKQEER